MTPLLLSCWFKAKREADGQYDRLARVLAYTAGQHCPDWDIRVEPIEPDIMAPCTGNPSHAWNAAKLAWWNAQVQGCPDGTPVVLMDADMMILRPLAPVWDLTFDVAYTTRDAKTSRLPLNGGFVALRASASVKAALARWQSVDDAMCREGTRHAEFHRKYAGMNQASFGFQLEQGGFSGLELEKLPCQEWNCCEWLNFAPNTRVVHVKSRLRRTVFNSHAAHYPNLIPIAHRWHALERAAQVSEVVAS